MFVLEGSCEEISFEQLLSNSNHFSKLVVEFPTKNNLIKSIAKTESIKQDIVQQAKQTRPIIHERTLQLIDDFLKFKRNFGSDVEKLFYKNLDSMSFINRMLRNRPIVFYLPSDFYFLSNKQTGSGGFEKIGTDKETAPLLLKDCLSYDEIQIAALLSVSTPTYFINAGDRYNYGKLGIKEDYEEKGVYVGLVGTRFEKPNVMEWQHMIITKNQNTVQNGYGPNNNASKLLYIWAKYYNISHFPTIEEVVHDTTGKYLPISEGSVYLHVEVYKKRLVATIEPFLADTHDRASKIGKKAYVHVVGIGLGVWQKIEKQAAFMLEVYAEVLKSRNLSSISDINFSWFPSKYTSCGGVANGEMLVHGSNQVKIHFSKRNPADKLKGEDSGKLLVASYAWDGNAFPGNEYFIGGLAASGDPAAACCSTIPELQNPFINPCVSSKTLFTVK